MEVLEKLYEPLAYYPYRQLPIPTVYLPKLSIKNNEPLSPLVAVKDALVLELYES